ncbi:hypothetical protein FKP32DRAFT_1606369 [Trametes sanguinea]|nr:hypothetical protein FKP32DRAFT_1606369 [Trametes sanguinea]
MYYGYTIWPSSSKSSRSSSSSKPCAANAALREVDSSKSSGVYSGFPISCTQGEKAAPERVYRGYGGQAVRCALFRGTHRPEGPKRMAQQIWVNEDKGGWVNICMTNGCCGSASQTRVQSGFQGRIHAMFTDSQCRSPASPHFATLSLSIHRMARGKRSRKQLVVDQSLVADYDLSLDDVTLPQAQFSAENVSLDQRRLHREAVPLPNPGHSSTSSPPADDWQANSSLLAGIFADEDPFFMATGDGALCADQSSAVEPEDRALRYMSSRWDGRSFERTSLKALGLVVGLGHCPDAAPCTNPVQSRSDFTVVDVNGRHMVTLTFCGCDRAGEAGDPVQQLMRHRLYPATDIDPNTAFTFSLLEHYHIQSLQGKISMYDYYTSLERLTDNTGVTKLQDRYKAFMRVVAQWRHLKLLKRAGRGHDLTGVEGTQPGKLALRFLYIMSVAIDACFRLKRRAVSNEEKDPILGSGWTYFVQDAAFREILKGYLDQEEISTCTGLSAIDHANTKFSKGYAATGIGAVVCARHEFWLPLGAGDLQKGERYVNMDYIFVSALREWLVLKKIVSYDIACQWSKSILDRIANFPAHIQIPLPEGTVMYVIPKLHYSSHQQLGHSKFSLNYRVGCARTDSEGIERRWWWLQPIANSTKVMGPGMRQGVLEDQWGYSNWRKTVDLVWTLSARLKEAVRELGEHQALFQALTENLQVENWTSWEEEVKAWEADPENCDDLSVLSGASAGLTEGETVRELSQEEQEASSVPGFIALHSVSLLGFITMGLEIEAQQMLLAEDARSAPPSKLAELLERRTSLRQKIQKYRELQAVYTPAIIPVLHEDPRSRTDVQEIERVRIGLPSKSATPGARLREAQCRDALQDLRNKLHTINQLYRYKKLNVRNQAPNTRARSSIAQQDTRKDRAVRKYRHAHCAKLALSGPGDWQRELQVLEDHHVRGLEDDDPRAVAERKRRRGASPGPAEGRRQLSWIWRSADVGGLDGMIDSLQVEWLKARARKMRWAEEAKLLPEEMRRVLATYRYEHQLWLTCASARPVVDPTLREGLISYAVKQARIRTAMAAVFRRVCLPVAQAASSKCADWEHWEKDEDIPDLAVEQEEQEFTNYMTLYHLDGEDLEPSYPS